MSLSTQDSRLLDCVKGMGIVLVVCGHSVSGPIKYSIYLFHMPMFYVISGLTFYPEPLPRFFVKKLKRILLPYASWLLIFNCIALGGFLAKLASFRITRTDAEFYLDVLKTIAHGGPLLTGAQSVFWFPTALFLTLLAVNVLARWSISVVTFIAVASYVATYAFPQMISWMPSAWGMRSVGGAIPFVVLGWIARERKICAGSTFRSFVFFGGSATVAALSVLAAARIDGLAYNFKYADFGTPLVSFGVATILSSITFEICRAISNYFESLAKYLSVVGRSSMTIMYLHMSILLSPFAQSLPWSIVVLGAVAVPIVVHQILSANAMTASLLLGSSAHNRSKARLLSFETAVGDK